MSWRHRWHRRRAKVALWRLKRARRAYTRASERAIATADDWAEQVRRVGVRTPDRQRHGHRHNARRAEPGGGPVDGGDPPVRGRSLSRRGLP